MKSKLKLPRFWLATLAYSVLACTPVARPAAAQAAAQTQTQTQQTQSQPACTPPATSSDKSKTNDAAASITKAANSISNIGNIFGKKKATQDANKVANVAGGCDATVNAAAADAGTVVGAAKTAGSAANSNSSGPAIAPAATPNSSVAAQPANGAAAPQPQSSSALYTPPPSAPVVFTGPLDPSKLPDISGLHLGITLAEAKAALQKLYPSARIDALNGGGIGPQNIPAVSLFRVQGDNTGHNEAGVDFTAPPNPQVVWHMARNTPQPHVAHNVLVAALRQKYGKETFATANTGVVTTDDSSILQMWWVFDERGQPVSGAKMISGTPFGCGSGSFTNTTSGTPYDYYRTMMADNTGGLSTFCASSYVGVLATMTNQQIVDNLTTDIVDLPLLVRSAKATNALSKAEFDKARQQDMQKSNQVKPAL